MVNNAKIIGFGGVNVMSLGGRAGILSQDNLDLIFPGPLVMCEVSHRGWDWCMEVESALLVRKLRLG
jgi:hypothetical protein